MTIGSSGSARVLAVAILALLAVGGSAGIAATPDGLYLGLLKTPPAEPPAGFPSPSATAMPLGADEKAAGMVGAVRIAFGGGDAKAEIDYYVFRESGAGITYDNAHLVLSPGARIRLAYPPFAECGDRPDGGYCEMFLQDKFVAMTARAGKVDGGAAVLMAYGYERLNAVAAALNRVAPPAPVIGGIAPCGLATKTEIEAALGGPAGPAQADRIGGCAWHALAAAGDGVTIQPKEGGRSQFDFDRGRLPSAVPLSGLGDAAFAFASPAGFVQLNLLKGDRYVVIMLQRQNDPRRLETAKTLGAEIAGRL